jgi:hypothetical protein
LLPQERTTHRVHRDAFGRFVERRYETENFDIIALLQLVEHPGRILAAAPGNHCAGFQLVATVNTPLVQRTGSIGSMR